MAIADVGPFEDPVTEEQRAGQVENDVFAAAAAGDGERFCGLLTPDARDAIEIAMAQRLQTDEPRSASGSSSFSPLPTRARASR